MYVLTKKGSINADCGVIRKNDKISDENYNTLSKRQKSFCEKFVVPVQPVDELKALEKANAVLEKKVADLKKINSVTQKKNEALQKEIAELKSRKPEKK